MKPLADENFDNTIVRGLLRRNPNIDIVRVQDVGLLGKLVELTPFFPPDLYHFIGVNLVLT
ncbi:MAG: hypothetical protein WCO29_09595 [Nostocales cyanobacterium ELA583]